MGLNPEPRHPQNFDNNAAVPLLELRRLSKHFPIRSGIFKRQIRAVKAVDQVDLAVFSGETISLVGGPAAGKTVLARMILQLQKPTTGKVLLDGEDLSALGRTALRQARQQLQLTLQDPYTALNPKLMVSDILGEPFQIHKLADGRSQTDAITDLLQLVGLNPYFAGRFPHEFSGSQRQRINIARALATQPKLLVADDPLTVLDTAVQPQIVALLAELKQKMALTILLMVRDLTHVRTISDRIGVLFNGQLVELGDTEMIYERPLHPYTLSILSHSQPGETRPNAHSQPVPLYGRAPEPVSFPNGCPFYAECPYATDLCHDEKPALRDLGTAAQPHLVSCHHAERFQD